MKKKKAPTKPRDWGTWEEAVVLTKTKPEGISDEDWNRYLKYRDEITVWINNIYQVAINDVTDDAGANWKWLSIKRRDKKVIHDWRHLQRIKNELVGYECEAIEIYPPDSQLVDEANQYHLWVMPPGMHSPVGFREGRRVGGSKEAATIGARQRDFEEL